ncbi:TRAP transporter small permease [Aestuariibacter sp. A3R04]|uniref:TRAP transporter small permease n=1 Tax=Aestuariibacter sp. A3R04 TaxID=2841571 RepID=UPI001C091C51|nr:TRAP transporter small permease [Aestuariibacter sp. A3R04]MBU3021323.1 TRAP transporter small permease [Aestuariibacter sp. A3R04]
MPFEASEDIASHVELRLHREEILSIALFWLLGAVLLAQVLSRYVLNAPLGWTEEVARYQLILITFTGAAMGFRKHTHISFTYFQLRLPPAIRKFTQRLVLLTNVLILLFLFVSSVIIAMKIRVHEMSALSLSFSYLYGLIGVTLLICLFRAVQQLLSPPSIQPCTTSAD